MIVKIEYKFGQAIYIKNDDEQIEYRLNRIILEQKNLLTLELLNRDGELVEVAEIHCSKEKDKLRMIGSVNIENQEKDDE
jgi:hypothetical protein